jgi:hypothetical protein
VTNAALTKPAAPERPSVDWPARYVAEADEIFNRYRAGTDAALHNFDWRKAEIRLQDAADQGRTDDETMGKLALAKGYDALERLSVGLYTDKEAAAFRAEARRDFDEAERRMPQNADAHLAMARIFVYSMPDLTRARTEFAAAEKLGAKPTPRDIEEQADAWRIHAQQMASTNPREAWEAAQQARGLYRQIPRFDKADDHLKELARIRKPAPKMYAQKNSAHRGRRWQ